MTVKAKTNPSTNISPPPKKKVSARKKRAKQRTVAEQLADYAPVVHKRKKVAQDELRNKFKGMEYIKQLEQCAEKLDELITSLDACKKRRMKLTISDRLQITATSAQLDIIKLAIDAVKVKIDLNVKRLRFVLPELKSMALTDDEGNDVISKLALTMASITQNVSRTEH